MLFAAAESLRLDSVAEFAALHDLGVEHRAAVDSSARPMNLPIAVQIPCPLMSAVVVDRLYWL